MNNKRTEQLGMPYGTASGRLVKDILFKFICETGKNVCYQCGKEMSRDTFSIEHKIPWIDHPNPIETFFDLDNISFSHLSCNVKAARNVRKLPEGEANKRKLQRYKDYKIKNYTPEKRREQYLRTGK